MSAEIGILSMSAFSIGILHTILGPDHYLPVAAIAQSGRWSAKKTFWITALCGLGHVLGSVAIGSLGLLLGTMLMQLEALESIRSETAAWLLIGFGLAYTAWGMVIAIREIPPAHGHFPADGKRRWNSPTHELGHVNVHERIELKADGADIKRSITPWVLFLIFALGPCEALIPLMMYPAAGSNFVGIAAIVLAFATATIGTMLATVMLVFYGLKLVKLPNWRRYGHAFAGLTILLCGVLVKIGW